MEGAESESANAGTCPHRAVANRIGAQDRRCLLVAGLFVLTAVGIVLALALRQTATTEAIRVARLVTSLEATSVVGQVSSTSPRAGAGPMTRLDQVVRQHMISSQIVRVKVWDATGRIVYSDDRSLVGKRFPLGADDLTALKRGGAFADVTDLTASENMGEEVGKRLLQVYLGVKTPTGQRLLFETYQPYQSIIDSSRRLWLTSLPVLLGGKLLLLYLDARHRSPTGWPGASKRSQDEREACCSPRWPPPTGSVICSACRRAPSIIDNRWARLAFPTDYLRPFTGPGGATLGRLRAGRSHRQRHKSTIRPDPPGSDRPSIPCNSRALRRINPSAVHTLTTPARGAGVFEPHQRMEGRFAHQPWRPPAKAAPLSPPAA